MTLTVAQQPLLQAAVGAQAANDLGRANDLFKQHLQSARNDPAGLGHYGIFCLQTEQTDAACYYLSKAAHLLPGDAEILTHLGYAQLQSNDHEAAHVTFKAALKVSPSDPLALNGIGLCHMQAGSLREALHTFEQADVEKNNVPILINIADAHFQLGDQQQGIEYFEQARAIAPLHPSMLLEYAKCLRGAGLFSSAIQMLDALPPDDRNQPLVMLEASRARRQMGQYAQAIELLETLNRLLPDTPEYHEEMGHCLPQDNIMRHAHWEVACMKWIDAHKFSQAGTLLEKMLGENPDDAAVWNLNGIFHEATQEFELAERAFTKTLELDSECVAAYANLATLFEEINRLPEAQQIADAGLQLVARLKEFALHPYIELCLASCKIVRRQKQFDRGIELLDRLTGVALSAKQQETAKFEYGRLRDLQELPHDAMTAFTQANDLVQQRWVAINPGPNNFLAEVEGMLEFAQRGGLGNWQQVDKRPSSADHGRDPVFLIGFPRSGTTLLNQILECNSFIQTIEERPMVTRMRDVALLMSGGYPRVIQDCDTYDVAYLRDTYFKAAREQRALDPSGILIDKFPLHIVKVGLIQRVFPQARFIFSARHPCDVCLSCFMQNFRPNDAMANFFSLADTVALYVRTMELWQIYQDKLPISVHTVRYDDMVNDVEGETRKVCDYLGVPWQESQSDFAAHALRRGKIHTPSYEQVSQPIYRGALGRWEKYREYFEPYLPALQPYIDKYG